LDSLPLFELSVSSVTAELLTSYYVAYYIATVEEHYVEHYGPTQRLELNDPYLSTNRATVIRTGPDGIVLDRSCIYLGGGGQPHDTGKILRENKEFLITNVKKVEGNAYLTLSEDGSDHLQPGDDVEVAVDFERRYQLMRTHTAMHLVAAVLNKIVDAPVSGSAMEPLSGRLDFDLGSLSMPPTEELSEMCNLEVQAARELRWYHISADDQSDDLIKTAANLLPKGLTHIRIVEIEGLDRQADGGTHVKNTSEIGKISIDKVESKGKGFKRVRISLS
jgi:misacylated tRNA(Ala) deacylase